MYEDFILYSGQVPSPPTSPASDRFPVACQQSARHDFFSPETHDLFGPTSVQGEVYCEPQYAAFFHGLPSTSMGPGQLGYSYDQAMAIDAAHHGWIIYIIRHRVDPDVFDGSGGTPVICAMHLDSPHDWNTIKLLFQLGANTQARVGVATIALFWSYPDFARAMGKENLAKQMEKAIALDKSYREIPDYHLID